MSTRLEVVDPLNLDTIDMWHSVDGDGDPAGVLFYQQDVITGKGIASGGVPVRAERAVCLYRDVSIIHPPRSYPISAVASELERGGCREVFVETCIIYILIDG